MKTANPIKTMWRIIERLHDKKGLFCIYCVAHKLHLRAFYLKDVDGKKTCVVGGKVYNGTAEDF